jgi:hypothetical protein
LISESTKFAVKSGSLTIFKNQAEEMSISLDRKTTYKSICETASLPFYMHPWWLETICKSGDWDVLFSQTNDGQIRAVFPFYLTRYRSTRVLINPALTPHIGIYYLPEYKPSNPVKLFSWEKHICSDLIMSLPRYGYFQMKFHPSFQNWLPLKWLGFRQTTFYTSIIYPEKPDDLFNKFSKSLQNDIRKAETYLTARSEARVDTFLELHAKTFKQQGKKIPYSGKFIRKVDQVLMERDIRKIYTAYSKSNPVASIYIVRDFKRHFYLMSGQDRRLYSRGAVSLLLWHAIQDACKQDVPFDFEGSSLQGIQLFFMQFSPKLESYFQIQRFKSISSRILFIDKR